ncbi:MAG: hypothetical protein RR056_05335 [Acetivibrio sp.]
MKIYIDKAQQDGKHELKHDYFISQGYELVFLPLPEGDYVLQDERFEDMINEKLNRNMKISKNDISFGNYISVDTKRNIQEVIGNICGKSHGRFRDECKRAMHKKVKFYVLIENEDGVKTVNDLYNWENPRMSKTKWITTPSGQRRKVLNNKDATSGETLAKAMKTMEERYGVNFLFCTPLECGKKVLDLLVEKSISYD